MSADFATRREAEITVERLVQGIGLTRTDIFIVAISVEDSIGNADSGFDMAAGAPSPERWPNAPLEGRITVSIDIEDGDTVAQVRAFAEFNASEIREG